MCEGADRAALAALDRLVLRLIDRHGLTEDAESVMRALYAARGGSASADLIFDWMFAFDPDGGAPDQVARARLRAAVAELDAIHPGLIVRGRNGWRLILAALSEDAAHA